MDLSVLREGRIYSVSCRVSRLHNDALKSIAQQTEENEGRTGHTTQIPEIVLLAKNVSVLSAGRMPRDTIWVFVQL